MSRHRNTPAMLAGIVLVTLVLTSQLLSTNLFDEVPSSRENRDGFTPGAISSSAANEIVQLAGTNQVVRYAARNDSAVNIENTPAANNLTLPATTAPATVLDATNTSLKFDMTTFNANHTIEDDSGFDFPYISSANATQSWLNTSAARMPTALQVGTGSNYRNLNFEPMNTAWQINSVGNIVRINLSYAFSLDKIQYPYSIRLDLWLKMKFNVTVSMNVKIYDNHNNQGWVLVNNPPFVYTGDASEPLHDDIIKLKDQRSQSIRTTNPCVNVSIEFTAGQPFRASLYTVKARLYRARDLEINANRWVALSFDLRGDAWVNGFSMYMRSFSIVSTELLTMRVFKSNNASITLDGIGKTSSNSFYQRPDWSQPVAGTSRTFNYTQDGINWFNFSAPVPMGLGNYFVVFNTSVPAGIRYRLVVLPWEEPSGAVPLIDDDDDQTVAVYTGTYWYEANFTISSSAKQVDAAPFIVGLKRGLIPSDVDMKINGTKVLDWQMSEVLPFSSTNYEWGRGDWSRVNINARTTTTTFKLPITWNQTAQTSFVYNASSYMLVHAEDPGASWLKLSRSDPLWKVSYQFNWTKYASWRGLYFNFTFPSDWGVLNVTYPDDADYYNTTYLTSISGGKKMYQVDYKSINGLAPGIQQNTYVAWFTSPNYTKSVDTYLRYNATTFYETQHFANDDSMSARVSVQTGSGKPVLNGQVNLTLFYPNDNPVNTTTSSAINSTVGFVTKYNFGDASLHTFTGAAVGRHLARVFWFNGSEAGIYYHEVFKVNYTVIGYQVEELLDEGVNQVSGSFTTGANESIPTNLVYVSIDKEDVVPIGLVLNDSIGDIMFTEFNQTQTVFNPSESIGFNVKLKSTSLGLSHQVWTNVQIVQAFHPDRVIMNLSTAPVVLNYTGGVDSERTLALSGNFPAFPGSGVNAPLRNSLFMTRVRIYIDGYLARTWMSDETYAVRMDNATDGTVLAAKVIRNYTGTSFSQLFTRANETVYNQETMFMMLLESSGGITLPGILARDFKNSMTSVIRETAVVPVAGDVLTINNSVVLSGKLYLEDGRVVNDTTVQVSRHNGATWVPYYVVGSTTNNSLPTSNGTFSGTFKLPETYNRTLTVRFFWLGNGTVVNTTAYMVVNITEYAASFTIEVRASSIVVVGGSNRNFYTFVVNNTGNTTLMFDEFAIVSSDDITGELASWRNAGTLNIAPGTGFTFTLVLTADNPGITSGHSAHFTIALKAFSIETKKDVNVTQEFEASIQPPDLGSQLASVWYLGYFAVIALLVIVAFFLLKRVSAQAKRPAGAGTLTKGKAAARGGVELPYAVKKGADIAKPEGEKKYKSFDEALAEVQKAGGKGDATGGDSSGGEEAGELDAGDAKPADETEKEEE